MSEREGDIDLSVFEGVLKEVNANPPSPVLM
jgi:hypothetical protein